MIPLIDGNAPGRLARIDGNRVHYLREGRGPTPIVYVTGLGVWSPHHAVLHEKLSAVSDTILIDRPGYGWSNLSRFPRTIEVNAQDLAAQLTALNVPAPAVIAGHSYGGLVALSYAALFPEAVKAVVLVDSAHPDQWRRFPPALGQFFHDRPIELMRRAALTAVNAFGHSLDEHAYSLSGPDDEAAVRAALEEPALHVAMASELENAASPPQAFPLSSGRPLDIPLTVLTARYSFEHFIPDRTNALYKEAQAMWLTLQHEYLDASRQSVQRFADADHALHVSDPDSIVSAVTQYL